MEETRVFNGFMDLETAPEAFREGDYLSARNLRKKSTTDNNAGRRSFFNDFVLDDSAELPSGNNVTLKSVVNDSEDSLYSINYNSEGYHTIVRYSLGGGQVIFSNLSDSGNIDLLGWDNSTIITDAVIHLNRWLILTDSKSEIKMFDLVKLEEGYGRNIEPQDITLAKASPLNSPTPTYIDSTSISSNNLTGKIFRFKYKYIYEGGFESAWSPTSIEAIPDNLNSVANGIQSDRQNLIRLLVPIRQPGLDKVIVAGSSNGGEWVILRDMSIADINSLPTSRVDDSDEIRIGSDWEMSFYNPLAFNLIPADEADHNYDAIPRSAKTLDVVNNNTLLLGGLTEGYDRLPSLDVSLTPASFRAGVYSTVTGRGTLKVLRKDIVDSWGDKYQEFLYIELTGTPIPGDIIKVITNYGLNGVMGAGGQLGSSSTADVFEYTVQLGETSMAQVYAGLARVLPNGQVFTDSNGTYVGFHYGEFNYGDMRNVKTLEDVSINLNDIGYVDLPTMRTFKKGSTVQFALSYKDKYGRYFPLETSSQFEVQFPQSKDFGYKLDWQINHQPPIGAASYQWMVSEDMKYQNYVDIFGEWEKGLSKPGRYMIFDLTSLNRYNNRGIPGVSYTFTPGDRVYLISRWASVAGEASNFDTAMTSRTELSVIDFEVKPVTPTDSQYLLKVQFNQTVWDELISFSSGLDNVKFAIKMEIFTPKIIDSNLDTTLFREIGPAHPIENGQHTVTSGTLEGIDDFIRGRVYEAFSPAGALGVAVESRTISDDTSDIALFRGNVRSYNDQIVGRDLRGSIRFSDISTPNSVYNGINKFFEGRIYGEGPGETTSRNGWIIKMKVVGNYLKVLQEDEVGVVPVYLSMIQDNAGDIQTADSDRLLNTVRYIGGGKVGIGKDPRSFAINERGTIFFFDSDRKIPFVLSGMSLTNVSAQLGNYFNRNFTEPLVAGCLHSPHGEYWLTFNGAQGVQTIVLDDLAYRWITFTDNVPESISNLNGEVYTFKTGQRYLMDKNSRNNIFYGEQFPSYIDVLYPAGFVRTFQSLAVHADSTPETSEDGIKTSLDLVSDLVKKDFRLREGIWYANFLRDKPSGLYTGKFLKGRWLSINFRFDPLGEDLNLFKIVVKSKASTANE